MLGATGSHVCYRIEENLMNRQKKDATICRSSESTRALRVSTHGSHWQTLNSVALTSGRPDSSVLRRLSSEGTLPLPGHLNESSNGGQME